MNTYMNRAPRWIRKMTATFSRCHIAGALTTFALVVCIAWVWSRNMKTVSQIEFDGVVVDLTDAATLIDNANQWRQQYTVAYNHSQNVDGRVESIAEWLPTDVDWPDVQKDIHALANDVELTVKTIRQGDKYTGTRAGVVTATCDVQGSYASLCLFLNDLAGRPQPIACSEIALHRTSENAADETDSLRCNATVTLRIPYAAGDSAAGRLLLSEAKHAS